jgi:Uncharacterized protein conserved in bacteria (DUF2087)
MSLPLLPASLQPLAGLFVKLGVRIGALSDAQRRLVLGMVWAGLPGTLMSERDVNEALKAQLASAANFLDTDHVELRRWLVDVGWLWRDGFGRQYQRVVGVALPLNLQPLATAFEGFDAVTIAAATRSANAAERYTRQRAWSERHGQPS